MSPLIIEESQFMLHSMLMGIVITFGYDVFRLLRRVVPHGVFWISMEDLIFWIICSIGIFYLFYEENNGTFRWFAVICAAVGMLCYKKMLSNLFVEGGAKVMQSVFSVIGRILSFLLAPFRKWNRWRRKKEKVLRKKAAARMRLVKKKLTVQLKMIKIILCKQFEKQQKAGDKKNGKKKTGIS